MKKHFRKIAFFLLISAVFIPFAVQAVTIEPPVKWENINDLINALINFVFYLAVIILPAVIMYGGSRFIMSRGDPKEFEEGKKILIWAGIGFLIMLMAKGVVQLISDIFLK